MPIRFLLDENLPGPLRSAVNRHNASSPLQIDALRVGDPPDLPRGTRDADILLWAEAEQRIVVPHDVSTLPLHLSYHLQAGHHSPGIFVIRRGTTLQEVIESLVLVANASDPREWADRTEFIPL